MLRILFLEWDSFGQEYIKQEFHNAGFETDDFLWPFSSEDMRNNPDLADRLSEKITEGNYAFVFSLNFFPVAAMTCFSWGIKYVSWVYDSPFILLYSIAAGLGTNYIYLFDKSEYEKLRNQGVKTVHYLPLAAPVEYYDQLTGEEGGRFRSEISFIGSTYQEDKQNFMKWLMPADEYTKGYLEGIIMMQHQIPEGFLLEELLTEDILKNLEKACPIEIGSGEFETREWIYANYFLARRTTAIDRICALRALSEVCCVNLFTPEVTPELPDVNNMGTVDYQEEMPLVIKNSKINLNITLRSIHTGIPLRAMDILGCGGFLLTDYQADLLEFFEPGVDFVFYTDEQDLCRKALYYLEHDEERERIARNGYEKVKANHTYRHRIQQILSQVFSSEETELLETYERVRTFRSERSSEIWYVYLNKNKQSLGSQELMQGTELAYADMERERKYWFQIKELVMGRINFHLTTGTRQDWDSIVILLNHKIVREMNVFFHEFTYIVRFAKLYLKEKEANFIFFESIKSTEAMEEMYRRICFFLRRIEFDMPDLLVGEFISYILENRISLQILYFVLNEEDKLYNKEKIRNKLTALLQKA